MFTKLLPCALLTLGITVLSCNQEEKKQATPATQAPVAAPTPQQAAAAELPKLQQEFAKDTNNIENRNLLAAKLYAAGELEKAAEQFNLVYQRDPKNLVALSNLGNIYYDSQQDDLAIDYYEKALAIDPNNINMRCDLATSYSNINKLKKAIQILEENIKNDPKHPTSHYNLSVILKKKGDIKEAEKEMEIYKSLTGK